MNCYNHPETAAVGMCKSCSKGICTTCVGKSKGDLVCAVCETRLIDGDKILASAKMPYSGPRKSYGRPVFLMAIGVIYVAAFGLREHRDYVSVAIGLAFAIYGGYLFFEAYRFNQGHNDDLLDD